MCVCVFLFCFLPFNTLFSMSSDIQRVGEGHPSACLTNYKWLIAMLAHIFHSPFMHFESSFETVVHNHENTQFVPRVYLFVLMLYISVNNFSVMLG